MDYDISILTKNWTSIIDKINKDKYILMEPSLDEKERVHSIILNYLKDNKRKIYGGYCLFELIKIKNVKDAEQIYKKDIIPDIDFYSPEPLSDVISICDILHKNGFKYVISREAMHHETYNISVNSIVYCDITYVPKNIYNKIPYKEVNKLILTHPHFLMIDYLRIFNDPMNSYWKFDNDMKPFKRFVLLQKYYPINTTISKDFNIIFKIDNDINKVLNDIYKFLLDNNDIIVQGLYAYNYFLMINNNKGNNIPYYELISINYKETCLSLLAILKTKYNDDINYTELFPFFQFTGYSTEIYFKDNLIVRIYCNNNMCIPYQKVFAYNLNTNTISDKYINIGTYTSILMYGLITIMRSKVCNDTYTKNLYYTFVINLINMRNVYLLKYKKTYLDNTIFKEFITDCIGKGIRPELMRKLLIENRKKNNKKLTFTYEPANNINDEQKDNILGYTFANTSGNIINNNKKLKLIDEKEDIS